MLRDNLGDRMKRYEEVTDISLIRRMPVAIRLDMKSGHTFTRGFVKPFDNTFRNAMDKTMKYLCENITGCVFGYSQSDEITLILVDYQTLETDSWFNNRLEKMVSISASMATMAFNRYFKEEVDYCLEKVDSQVAYNYRRALASGAIFDSRCFNVPKEDVVNLVFWRQQDATRNSINSLAQSFFTQKELQGLNTKVVQDKMLTEKNINWNDLRTDLKRGSACIKKDAWFIDRDMPILKNEGRSYLSKLIEF